MIDDDEGWIDIVSNFLKDTENFDVFTCNHAEFAEQMIEKSAPDVILIDVDLGILEYNGIGLAEKLKNKTQAKIIMFTISQDKEMIEQAIIAGAVDFVVKSQFKETLVPVILRSLYHFSSDVIVKAVRKRDVLLKISTLTKTEQAILKRSLDGKNAESIQEELKYEKQSYWNCIGKIKKKLNVNSMKDAVTLMKDHL
jgi:Response regulator containing a CheY-like receiver domain and an HTH DNA-binding domain